jgi:hypothetical protein
MNINKPRISQTYLIKNFKSKMISDGWECLYSDLPGGLRSGIGNKKLINTFFEQNMDKIPDLIFYKENNIIICEVDHRLEEDYLKKFNLYQIYMKKIISFFSTIMMKKIENCKFYFIYKIKNTNNFLKKDYKKKHIKLFFFNDDKFLCD